MQAEVVVGACLPSAYQLSPEMYTLSLSEAVEAEGYKTSRQDRTETFPLLGNIPLLVVAVARLVLFKTALGHFSVQIAVDPVGVEACTVPLVTVFLIKDPPAAVTLTELPGEGVVLEVQGSALMVVADIYPQLRIHRSIMVAEVLLTMV